MTSRDMAGLRVQLASARMDKELAKLKQRPSPKNPSQGKKRQSMESKLEAINQASDLPTLRTFALSEIEARLNHLKSPKGRAAWPCSPARRSGTRSIRTS